MKRATSLIVHDEVELDVDEAAFWYLAEAGAGVRDRFLDEVEETLRRILDGPEKYQVVHRSVRRAPLHRFPYGVFFRCDGELKVQVIAIASLERRPLHWARRLDE